MRSGSSSIEVCSPSATLSSTDSGGASSRSPSISHSGSVSSRGGAFSSTSGIREPPLKVGGQPVRGRKLDLATGDLDVCCGEPLDSTDQDLGPYPQDDGPAVDASPAQPSE